MTVPCCNAPDGANGAALLQSPPRPRLQGSGDWTCQDLGGLILHNTRGGRGGPHKSGNALPPQNYNNLSCTGPAPSVTGPPSKGVRCHAPSCTQLPRLQYPLQPPPQTRSKVQTWAKPHPFGRGSTWLQPLPSHLFLVEASLLQPLPASPPTPNSPLVCVQASAGGSATHANFECL